MPANGPADMASRGSGEAPDAGQPGTGPGRTRPDAEHFEGLPPPTTPGAQAAGHAGAASSTGPAHRSDAGAPDHAAFGEAPTRGPPRVHTESEARATTPDKPKRAADRGTPPGGHTRRRLFLLLHGVLQGCLSHVSKAGCPARSLRATRRPCRGCTPHSVPPGTPPAR